MTRCQPAASCLIGVALLSTLASTRPAAAQGTAADYARAVALQDRYENAAIDVAGPPTAIPGTHRFWYRNSGRGGHRFVEVTPRRSRHPPPSTTRSLRRPCPRPPAVP